MIINIQKTLQLYENSLKQKQNWTNIWNECYAYTIPKNNCETNAKIFDSTAPNSVDELAGLMLNELSYNNENIVSFETDEPNQIMDIQETKKNIKKTINNTNFYIELHQCLVDLIICGTACMIVKQNKITDDIPISFSSISMDEICLCESENNKLDIIFKHSKKTKHNLINEYEYCKNKFDILDNNKEYTIIEYIRPHASKYKIDTIVVINDRDGILINSIETNCSPIIAFRWQKSHNEIYGRSPVMNALPDIKTANKVVELILKNASISVSGIWQADSDGILNPRNIKLVPGAIISKAPGSSGLQPLKAPGEFNTSQIILENLHNRIKKSLLVDEPSSRISSVKTATEINHIYNRNSAILESTFNRLGNEFLSPLIKIIINNLEKCGMAPSEKYQNLSYKINLPVDRLKQKNELENNLKMIEKLSLIPNISKILDLNEMYKNIITKMNINGDLIVK